MKITKKQKSMMEHALGLNYKKYPFRNRYCTYQEDKEWEDLKNKGLAKLNKQCENIRTYFFYYVTKEGQRFLGLKCECDELGCQNKFYGKLKDSPVREHSYCRKHYNMYR